MPQEFFRLRPNGNRTAHLGHDVPVCKVEITQRTEKEISYVHVSIKFGVETQKISDEPSGDAIKMGVTNFRFVQPTDHQTIRCGVLSTEKFTVDQTEGASCRRATILFIMSRLSPYVEQNVLLVQTSNIDINAQKRWPVSHGERILQPEQYPNIFGSWVRDALKNLKTRESLWRCIKIYV